MRSVTSEKPKKPAKRWYALLAVGAVMTVKGIFVTVLLVSAWLAAT